MTAILAFAGSSRKDSYNRMLLAVAAAGAERAGAKVTIANLADYPMPIFDEDFEAEHGLPKPAQAFRDLMHTADGFLIASPEYNSSFSALLKNVIDWASRPRTGEGPLACFKGKVAGLLAASPGYFGGYRGLQQVRYVLGNIGTIVLPDMFSLPQAHEAFNADGSMKDEKKAAAAAAIGAGLAQFLAQKR